jgi:hypothetical protein
MTWYRRLYFPSEGSRATDFYVFKNPSFSVGFEPANLWSNGKYVNHHTTEGDGLRTDISYYVIKMNSGF